MTFANNQNSFIHRKRDKALGVPALIALGGMIDSLAGLLTTPLQTLVVSSIVVSGNVVYWFEKERICVLK